MPNIDFSKYKIQPQAPAPAGGTQIDFSKYKIKTPSQSVPPPAPPISLGNRFLRSLAPIPGEAATTAKSTGSVLANTGKAVVQPLINTGSAIESGFDETLGRGINLATGKGNKPTQSGKAGFAAAMSPAVQPQGPGAVIGGVAPYFTPMGAEDAVANAPEEAGTLMKFGTALAKRAPEFAKNVAVGTAQTKNAVEGVGNAVLAEGGDLLLKGAGKLLPSAEKEAAKLSEMLTPRVVGKSYEKTGISGAKLSEPTLGSKAGVNPSSMKPVQHAIESVKNVASLLGKKTSDIINTGTAQITKNVNRVNDTISEYADKIVTPFLQKSGVNYGFSDLRDALANVKPVNDLKGEAKNAYNTTREKILSAVANKVSTQTTGGRTLAQLRNLADESGKIPQKITNGDKDFWDARKIIDEIGTTETKGKIFGSEARSGAISAWKDLRAGFKDYLSDGFRYPGQMDKVNKMNDFLSSPAVKKMDKTGWNISDLEKQFGLNPNPNTEASSKEWEQHMSNMEGLFNARTSIGSKLGSERGKNVIEIFAKEHPRTFKTLGTVAKVVGGGAVTALGLGFLGEGAKEIGF